jgi:hypothetical protein
MISNIAYKHRLRCQYLYLTDKVGNSAMQDFWATPNLFAVGLPGPERLAYRIVAEGAAEVKLALTKRSAIGVPVQLTSFRGPQ